MSGEIRQGTQLVRAQVIDLDKATADRIRIRMEPHLSPEQNKLLNEALRESMGISEHEDNDEVIERFINAKLVQGRSRKTLKAYKDLLERFARHTGKPLVITTADDIRGFMAACFDRGTSQVTVSNYRLYLLSFFTWCENEELVVRSPMRKVGAIKMPKTIKKPFSDKELELLRIECSSLRDRAMIEVLVSTGCRISELTGMDRKKIDMSNNSIVVLGKGNKERLVYFTDAAKVWLIKYLEERTDNNPALFVSLRAPYKRVSPSSMELRIRNIGISAGVENCHPHRFRRTMATNAIKRGMPIEQVQKLLGHEDLKTTMRYAIVDQELVATNARRLIG